MQPAGRGCTRCSSVGGAQTWTLGLLQPTTHAEDESQPWRLRKRALSAVGSGRWSFRAPSQPELVSSESGSNSLQPCLPQCCLSGCPCAQAVCVAASRSSSSCSFFASS